MSYKTQLLQR